MNTVIQTVRAAMNRCPETFNMRDLASFMREISPTLAWDDTTPYHSMERVVDLGFAEVVRERPKTWRRVRRSSVQGELSFEATGARLPDWGRARPGAVQDAVRAVILDESRAAFTSEDIKAILRWRDPEFWRVMSPSSVSSTLPRLEHVGMIERTGRRRGRCIEWRRRASASAERKA